MNLQFLSVGNNNGIPVAYFLDSNTKTVYMFNVVDMTGQKAPPTPVGIPNNTASSLLAPFTIPVTEEVSPQPATELPAKQRSIMPPGVAKMFQEGNETTMTPSGIQ